MTVTRKQATTDYLRRLKEACEWFGIEQGRARDYLRLLGEFDECDQRSDEHILSYYESYEIVELYDLWHSRVDAFPGLYDKLREACGCGPVLREGENPSSSNNRPRNDAFAFLMAGKFLAAGISVENVDKISALPTNSAVPDADFTFSWKGTSIDVECKRLQSKASLLKRAREARRQIDRGGRRGIIAIDCSNLYRRPGTLLETDSMKRAMNDQFAWLEANIVPEVSMVLPKVHAPSRTPAILGFLLCSRVPAMTATGVLDPNGTDIRRRDRISSLLAVGNRYCPDSSVLADIKQLLTTR